MIEEEKIEEESTPEDLNVDVGEDVETGEELS